jgi:osmotically-inducible protein OsmY
MKTDLEIQKDVADALARDNAIPSGALGVEVHHGVVKIAGNVTDKSILQASTVATKRVDGVTRIVFDVAHAPI